MKQKSKMIPPYYDKEQEIIECYRGTVRLSETQKNLERLIAERQCALDESFVWTDEAIARLKAVGEKADECLNHFKTLQGELPQWLKNQCREDRANFLNDFELNYQITPIVRWKDENGEEHEDEGIYEVLQSQINHSSHLGINYRMFEESLYFKSNDKDGYRMVTRAFDTDRLKGVRVNYVIHELSSHLGWSIQDILNISEFWGEVIVRGQHFAEVKQ